MECCCIWTVPTLPYLAYCSNLVVDERPSTIEVRNVAAFEFVSMGLKRFIYPVEPVSLGSSAITHWSVRAVEGYLSRFLLLFVVRWPLRL